MSEGLGRMICKTASQDTNNQLVSCYWLNERIDVYIKVGAYALEFCQLYDYMQQSIVDSISII